METSGYFTEDSFKRELTKKLTNFGSKLPIYDIEVKVAGNYIYFSSEVCKLNQKIEIDYSMNEKVNVRRVKDILIDYFPVLYGYQEIQKSIDDILREPITEDSVLGKKTVKKEMYRVERKLDLTNELICRNLETDQLEMYHMTCPLVSILKEMFMDIESASKTFKEKSVYVKQLEQRLN